MIRNYFKTAWRNLLRGKMFSVINIVGLAAGLAVCILITLFVKDELSYDRYNKKIDRIYRVNTDIQLNGSRFHDNTTPAPMAIALKNDFPQIEQATRLRNASGLLLKKGTETLAEQHAFGADANLFDVFTLPMLKGDPHTALLEPHTMVLSESAAEKYFNTTDIIGKTILTNNTTPYRITGVIKNTPAAAHLHFDVVFSLAGDENLRQDTWLSNNYNTYVLVKKGVTPETMNAYLQATARKYAEPQIQQVLHSSFKDFEGKGDYFRYYSIPLDRIHLYSTLNTEIEPQGNIQYVYVFSIIGIFILIIACVNFMNLATARSSRRAREVGVRKVLGSNRRGLILQFLSESILTCFISLVLAVMIAVLSLHYFNGITGKAIPASGVLSVWLIPVYLLIVLVIGLLAGIYPAFYLSGFNPVRVLKGRVGLKGSWLRNGLVVFQFSIAVFLIIGVLVIYAQLNYIREKDTGYNREQVLVLKNAYALGDHAIAFKNEVLKIPGVTAATRSSAVPTLQLGDWNRNAYSRDASFSAVQSVTLGDWQVDADFLHTMGMRLVAGRNFAPEFASDSGAVLLNETAARMLGYSDPVKEAIYDIGDDSTITRHPIIGVVKDFSTGSMRYKTEPVILRLSRYGDRFSFRIKSGDIRGVVNQIKQKYQAMDKMAGQPFLYSFMDDDFNALYKSEQRTGTIFIAFAIFAIGIACMGLFGLVSYATEQRMRELGIRKVLGAGLFNIVGLLSGDFLKLIAASLFIAFPLGGFLMHQWLRDFAYRTRIGWWFFAASGLVALLVAGGTIATQVIRAARMNPVKSLRSE
ncbi:ABC transporter permease [Niabella sp. CC-SYL272]|uniref:ABC transporter permease n=1 Tax=Niabella agricola TaxID=2891571 RepID=UPI001F1F0346|nr:ABC transporter permease [Niabella agricola]MCF3107482.1 ABC transporter permease [Niabella agricola]